LKLITDERLAGLREIHFLYQHINDGEGEADIPALEAARAEYQQAFNLETVGDLLTELEATRVPPRRLIA
jgi:hypothetical protein